MQNAFLCYRKINMFVTLHGAANEVTGSCYLVETGNARVLVDCGMFQGSKALKDLNCIPPSIDAANLDAVVLTHGHLDHCGRLPLLVKAGYNGKIYGTEGTIDIARLILKDSAKIQEDDAERETRKREKSGKAPVRPLYTVEDAEQVYELFAPLAYNTWTEIASDVNIELVEAGHILGSSSVIMIASQNGGRRRLIFSGDLGQWDMPINRDPASMDRSDAVFMECTYGGREHPPYQETIDEMSNLIKRTVLKKGKILVPTFAVGRTQQLLFHFYQLIKQGEIPAIPIYLDSPMAAAATKIYSKHTDFLDDDAREFFTDDNIYRFLPTLNICTTAQESQALNEIDGPCLILAGAGMCDAGRIRHHLRHNLGKGKTLVLIVGYQAQESLGRRLVDGVNPIKLMGESIYVRAKIASLEGFSAHADQEDLLRWLEPLIRHKTRIILTHGEPEQLKAMRGELLERFGQKSEVPSIGDVIEI